MWSWLASVINIFGGAQSVDDNIIDPIGTWVSNEVSVIVAKEPTWLQKPTKIIGQTIMNFGETAVDSFLGVTPEQLAQVPPEHVTAMATHATMNHPDVVAANPATINASGRMISPARPATPLPVSSSGTTST